MSGTRFIRVVLAALFMLPIPLRVSAQDYTFRRYSTADGLSDNQIHSLLQDSRGFLWVGTAEGLSRFDGAGFRNFFAGTDSLAYAPTNTITGLLEFKPRHLLINYGSRLGCANLENFRFYPPPEPFRSLAVHKVIQLNDGSLILAAEDSLYQTNPDFTILQRWRLPFTEAGKWSCAIMVLNRDTLLLSNLREHFFFQLSSRRFMRFRPGVSLSEEKNLINWEAYDPRTQTLYGSNYWQGLWQFSLSGSVLRHYQSQVSGGVLYTNHIGAVMIVSDSLLYVGTMAGLNVIDTRSGRLLAPVTTDLQTNALSGKAIVRLLRDRDGTVWMGTNEGLLKQVPALGKRLIDGDNPATPMHAEWSTLSRGPDGQLYAGSIYEGLWKLGNGTDPPRQLLHLPLRMVWVLQPQNNYMVTGGNGPSLLRFSPENNRAETIHDLKPFYGRSDILTLYFKDKYGDEWYSLNQGGGLIRRAGGTSALKHYHRGQNPAPFQLGYVALAAEDGSGAVWFAVNKSNHLLQWDRKTERFREWSLEELTGMTGQHFGGVQALLGGPDSVLWISSESVGLVAYHTGRRTARLYSIRDGLPTAYIHGLTRDHRDRIWMATGKGLVCLLEKEQRFVRFRKQQGLPDDNFTSGLCWFDTVTRTLLAGSGNKIIQLDPDRLLQTTRDRISLYLDDLRINGRDFSREDRSGVPYSFNNLQLGFTAVDLQNGTDLEYAYRLAGADPDWVFAGDKKTAFYHQLPPGTYRFEVRVRHKGETAWSSGKELFQLHIRKAWWQTWGFRSAMLLLALVLVGWLMRQYFRRKLRLQRQQLEQELAVEQERNRLARELHDGLGSQLSGVKHSFSALRQQMKLPGESFAVFDSTLEKLNDSINELRHVSHSMLSSGFLEEGLETALRNYGAALSAKGSLTVTVQSLIQEPLELGAETSFHLFRIVQELLQNVLKHAHASEALVQLSCHHRRLHITVEDNGKGMESRQLESKRGMGWRNVETRLKLIGGKAEFRSAPGQGTSVELEVPVSD